MTEHTSAPPVAVRPRRRTGARVGALAAARELVVVVVAALVVSLVVKTFLLQVFWIPSPSMQDTLVRGDRVAVSRLTPGPLALHRGDVVVFADPGGQWLGAEGVEAPAHHGRVVGAAVSALTFVGVLPNTSQGHLVKRVVGLPGDTVACCDAQGRTTVNGTPLHEDYLAAGAIPSQVPFSVTVPAGRLWVEGDNRQDSADSRLHQDLPGHGTVPERLVVGRAVARVWPMRRVGWLSDHHEVFTRVRAPG